MISTKEKLYNLCVQHVKQKIENAALIIADARETVRNETKSSAGDKYETTREMMQQDIDMNMRRIAEAKAQLSVLEQIDPAKEYLTASPGSVLCTNLTNYFIGVSAGLQVVNNISYQCISIASPVGEKMKGLKPGDSFSINGREDTITSIF